MVEKSNLYTRAGDDGTTSLVRGTRLAKSDPSIAAYGEVDELNSLIGLCICQLKEYCKGYGGEYTGQLQKIQKTLFVLGSNLACESDKRRGLPEITSLDVKGIEEQIDKIDGALAPLKNFILPGGSIPASFLHLARANARRVERAMATLPPDTLPPYSLAYINRLSDYLFVLARSVNLQLGGDEILWPGDESHE